MNTYIEIKFANNDVFNAEPEILKKLNFFKNIIDDVNPLTIDFSTLDISFFTKKFFAYLYERLKKRGVSNDKDADDNGTSDNDKIDNKNANDNGASEDNKTLSSILDILNYIKLLDYITDLSEREYDLLNIHLSGAFWFEVVTKELDYIHTFLYTPQNSEFLRYFKHDSFRCDRTYQHKMGLKKFLFVLEKKRGLSKLETMMSYLPYFGLPKCEFRSIVISHNPSFYKYDRACTCDFACGYYDHSRIWIWALENGCQWNPDPKKSNISKEISLQVERAPNNEYCKNPTHCFLNNRSKISKCAPKNGYCKNPTQERFSKRHR